MMLWMPLLAPAAALVLGLIADRLIALRSPDRGTYWARVLLVSLWTLCALVFAGWLLEGLGSRLWPWGVHLMQDLLDPASPLLHGLALTLPVLIWWLVLIGVAFTDTRDPQGGRWLAGSIGMGRSRLWVLPSLALPLGVFAWFAWERIPAQDPGADYPAAIWSLLVLAIVNLLFVALSKGQARGTRALPPAVPAPVLPAWPEALRSQGLNVEPLLAFGPEPGTAADKPIGEARLGDSRPDLAARRIPGQMLEAVVTASGDRAIMAPDDCGQLECVALHAERRMVRQSTVTLVVTPQHPNELRVALQRWLPDTESATMLDTNTRADSAAFLWLAESKTLSDRLIPHLASNPSLLARIGTLVWWDLHLYSGVLAANFWAISHRFQRLLDLHGRRDVRHLVFVRGEPNPDTQLGAFLNLCLPRNLRPETQTSIGALPTRRTELYLLGGCREGDGQGTEPRAGPGTRGPYFYVALAAARASVSAGWPTHLSTPDHIEEQALARLLADSVDGEPLGQRLAADPVTALARILEVNSASVLALPEILAQTGRAYPAGPPVQVGLVPAFGNPYVDYLLGRLRKDHQIVFRRKRRLVAAKPQPGVVQRHLLLALNELPATLSDLKRTFRWERSGEIEKTLRQLAGKNQVLRRDVRFLPEDRPQPGQSEHDRLEVEVEYRSALPRDRALPLATVGTRLVELRDPGNATVMRIDPERVTIDAYPFRVFLNEGRRYRVEQWGSFASTAEGDGSLRIDCRPEDAPVKTWRLFTPRLSETRRAAGSKDVQFIGRNMTRTLVATRYEERINGWIEYLQDDRSGAWIPRGHTKLPTVIHSPPMHTNGLLIGVPQEAVQGSPLGLHTLAQALRHVFPTHVGVDEDAVAVLALNGKPLDERPAWGLMLVDLYPGGIGLVQSMDEEPALLVHLLELVRDWLDDCPCRSESGCERCVASPLAASAVADTIALRLSRPEAVEVVRRMLKH